MTREEKFRLENVSDVLKRVEEKRRKRGTKNPLKDLKTVTPPKPKRHLATETIKPQISKKAKVEERSALDAIPIVADQASGEILRSVATIKTQIDQTHDEMKQVAREVSSQVAQFEELIRSLSTIMTDKEQRKVDKFDIVRDGDGRIKTVNVAYEGSDEIYSSEVVD